MEDFMNRRTVSLILAALIPLSCLPSAQAQMPAYTNAGPIPPPISSAKSIFVSNAGADSGLFPSPFSGDPDRSYTEFYAALKATGQYTLVGDPSKADLVLELRLMAPSGPTNPNKQNGASDPLPMFRMVVYQASTHYVLWSFTRSVELAFLQKSHDKNFDEALQSLLNQFLQLAGKPPVAPPAATH
jgi:hypothetical protein